VRRSARLLKRLGHWKNWTIRERPIWPVRVAFSALAPMGRCLDSSGVLC
jgi:hypothetical protein